MLLKLFGAVLLVAAGWYGGLAFCEKKRVRRVTLQECVDLLQLLEEEISFRHINLSELLVSLINQHHFVHCIHCSKTTPPCETNIAFFRMLTPPAILSNEEQDVFRECFAMLGYTTALQECQRLSHYRMKFQAFYERASCIEQQALSIDRKIGVAIGGMIALVFL